MSATYQTENADGPLAALGQVATAVTDAISGYEEMQDRAEGDLKPVVARLRDLHERHAGALYARIEDMGGRPEEIGSAMASVHSGIAILRDWTGTLDGSAIEAVLDGEDRIVAQYDDAIGASDADVAQLLDDQRSELKSEIAAHRS